MVKQSTKNLLTRRVEQILPSKKGLEKLLSKKKIKLYQGFDPSKPDLHIGHLVGLLQLKAFQDAGHEVIFLIGDFTGRIGDPTDKTATRKKLSEKEVVENARTYKEQAGKILDFEGKNPAKIMFNSKWLKKLDFGDVLELSSNLTVQQLLERDMFQKRLEDEKPIYLHEFMYPLLQGYDSVAMEIDLEIGGSDQLFNMMVGRQLLKTLKNKNKFVLTTKLLTDSKGNKIGKTTGNATNVFQNPQDLYGGVMSFSDDAIIPGFKLTTEVPMKKIQEYQKDLDKNPLKLKKTLAYEITKLCHNKESALKAQENFEKVVQKNEIPQDIPTIKISKQEGRLLDILKQSNLNRSSSEIKRTVRQGGVEVNGEKITQPTKIIDLKENNIIKFGKRTYRKISKE